MLIEFELDEIDTLLESLKYSNRQVSDAQDTPSEVRQQNLAIIDAVSTKLRVVRKALKD